MTAYASRPTWTAFSTSAANLIFQSEFSTDLREKRDLLEGESTAVWCLTPLNSDRLSYREDPYIREEMGKAGREEREAKHHGYAQGIQLLAFERQETRQAEVCQERKGAVEKASEGQKGKGKGRARQ